MIAITPGFVNSLKIAVLERVTLVMKPPSPGPDGPYNFAGLCSFARSSFSESEFSFARPQANMFIDEPSTRQCLVRMVRKLTSNGALREDMLQEALIHLWITEMGRPGQTRSWYLQSCKFHLLHYLAAGRSVDSSKRRAGQLLLVDEEERVNGFPENHEISDSVFTWVSARDLIALLSPQLSGPERAVLACFAEGLGLREIGRRLKISHTMVIRHRRKIAGLLSRLEPDSQPNLNGVKVNGSAHPPNGINSRKYSKERVHCERR